MTNPIKLTDAAVTHIKQMLEKNRQGVGFRLSVKKTGCSGLSYLPSIIEKISETDLHFVAQQGLHVYIDSNCLAYVQNVVLDYVEDETQGLKQKRLIFLNPNEKGRCGCGESFTIE